MATTTQYNPNRELNAKLLALGASKTVYALVTPETEAAKNALFGEPARPAYLEQFRDAWTAKQDAYHEVFFDTWVEWSKPVVNFDRKDFPFYYPCNGASEPLRHIIYDFTLRNKALPAMIHVFEGEYEGYKAMAEAAGASLMEWPRDEWRELVERLNAGPCGWSHLVCISQPSAIDGNVWPYFNEFVSSIKMRNCVVVDLTYVGAVPERSIIGPTHPARPICGRFEMNHPSIRNVIFSLSKPFGVYYDRIGGVFCREEDPGLFGNKWFKNLTSLALGTKLMQSHDVFYMPTQYGPFQNASCARIAREIGVHLLEPSDVYILAHGDTDFENPLADYLRRPEKSRTGRKGEIRVCLTPLMAQKIAEFEANTATENA